MLIKFNELKEETIKNFHGGAKEVKCNSYTDSYNRIMYSKILPQASNGKHQHTDSSEIMFVISGHGYAITDGVKEFLTPGVCDYCPKGSTHEVVNDGDVDLICYNVICKQ
jgi:Mannose-6-phosphate isomerase